MIQMILSTLYYVNMTMENPFMLGSGPKSIKKKWSKKRAADTIVSSFFRDTTKHLEYLENEDDSDDSKNTLLCKYDHEESIHVFKSS